RRIDGDAGLVDDVESRFAAMRRSGDAELADDRRRAPSVSYERSLDMRYVGQSYEVDVPIDGLDPRAWAARFHAAHAARYGHGHPDRAVEIVNARLRLRVPGQRVSPAHTNAREVAGALESPGGAPSTAAQVWFGRPIATAIVRRLDLGPRANLHGPAVIVQMDTTTVLNPGWAARSDAAGNLILERA
ncbi:MAG TPA: hydantoinase/oxoprolinase family protein, partial [Dehalococcoidia bacterium]